MRLTLFFTLFNVIVIDAPAIIAYNLFILNEAEKELENGKNDFASMA